MFVFVLVSRGLSQYVYCGGNSVFILITDCCWENDDLTVLHIGREDKDERRAELNNNIQLYFL